MKKIKIKETAVSLLIAAVWFAIGWVANGRLQKSDTALFEQVQMGLTEHDVNEMPSSREMTYGAIRGMVAEINDPHAAFLEPEMAARFQQDFNGLTGVTGFLPELVNGEWIVTVVLPGDPADLAGLMVGDVIISVDGVSFTPTLSALEASLLLRGPANKPAEVIVRRGDETLTLTPVRKPRPLVSEGNMLTDEIAYVAQYTFTANTPNLLRSELVDLLAQNPKAIIWDIRSNGGGSMDAAQEILSFFIEDGLLFLVEMKGGEQRPFNATGDTVTTDIPVVVLVSERTYSSAEAAAISMYENKRGILIGSSTYGKGTVQETVTLLDDSMLQYTVAHWLSPSGIWVEKEGFTPDNVVVDDPNTETDELLDAAVDYIETKLIEE
ncbi:MAG: PDZ domain-containing protein [Anaerolineales bacterium]|nr:PDZ domain-containing protein [Anaerolineales bacterium]